jgi:hypothetical protein
MAENTLEVHWLEPPIVSDGTVDAHPVDTYDEALIRRKYLNLQFLRRLWRAHPHVFVCKSAHQSKATTREITVQFNVPLDESHRSYDGVLLRVGRAIQHDLDSRSDASDITPPPLIQLKASSPTRSQRSDSWSSINSGEGLLDHYGRGVVSLDHYMNPPGRSNDDLSELNYDANQSGNPPSPLLSSPIPPKQTAMYDDTNNHDSAYKLLRLPDGYRLYERWIVTYPPPPPNFESLIKRDGAMPKITVRRSLVIFGHPASFGRAMSIADFIPHILWLYQITDATPRRYSRSAMACLCDRCPYPTT